MTLFDGILPLPSIAEFGQPAEGILKVAADVHAELIIMGLNRRAHVEAISHLPWSIAYDVVCGALCPVLTVRTDSAAIQEVR